MDNKNGSINKLIVIDVLADKNIKLQNNNDPKDVEEQLRLYKIYEYTDKFVYLTDHANYGTLWNYYLCGLLSEEEIVELLLL